MSSKILVSCCYFLLTEEWPCESNLRSIGYLSFSEIKFHIGYSQNVRERKFVSIHAMKPCKGCGCRAVFVPHSEPDRFEFHNVIINHHATNCKKIKRNNFLALSLCYYSTILSWVYLVNFSDQSKCVILFCSVRAVFAPSITCHGWKRHVTNTTTLKSVITSVLFVNYT
jgi:hypothetical protein